MIPSLFDPIFLFDSDFHGRLLGFTFRQAVPRTTKTTPFQAAGIKNFFRPFFL
jgi:hypothetical protein